jgi:nitroreductase
MTMTFEELLVSRRSVRRFRSDAPPDDLVQRLLELAISAPSASNKQPWRFLVVARRALIDELAAAVREKVDHIARHIPEDSQPAFRAYGEYFTRFEHAPRVIVPIFRGHRVLSNLVATTLDEGSRVAIDAMERDSGLVGTSLALMNLLLAAHSLGLGASAMTGPLVAVERLRELLRVPASWGIVAFVALGYPAEDPRPTDRKDVEKVVRWLR